MSLCIIKGVEGRKISWEKPFFIVLIAFYGGAMIIIPKFLTEEAAARLIKLFLDYGATAFWSARTVGEMKLDSRSGVGNRRTLGLQTGRARKLIESGVIREI
jgi:hypothetical protein